MRGVKLEEGGKVGERQTVELFYQDTLYAFYQDTSD